MTVMKVGMGQMLVEGGEPDRNMGRAEKMIREAASRKCDLVLLPECMDLAWTHPTVHTEAEPIPGPRFDRLATLAGELGISVCAGLTERDEEGTHNSAVLIDDKGELLLKYRKINLLEVEFPFYNIGRRLAVVPTRFGLIGLNICADNYHDSVEIGHTLARMGAQVILSPSSWTVDYSIDEGRDPYGEKWIRPLSTIAGLHGIVFLSVTSVGYIVGGPYEGKKSIGCSLAVGPDGIIAQGDFNEFAGELIVIEFEVPERKERGTQIGAMLKRKGYYK